MKYGTSGFTPTAPTGTQTVRLQDGEGAAYVYQMGHQITNVTTATKTLTAADAGIVTLNRAAGIALTLPAATAALAGLQYRILVGTTFTGAATVAVAADPGTDVMMGTAILFADGGDTAVAFATAADSDTLSLFGTANSNGGIRGAQAVITCVGAGLWHVEYVSDAGGTEATPFSATVAAP